MLKYLFLICILANSFCAIAQVSVSGSVIDSIRNASIEYASISIYPKGSDKVFKVVLSNQAGFFQIEGLAPNTAYWLKIDHLSFGSFNKEVNFSDKKNDMGRLFLHANIKEMKEVIIQPPVRMNGDTIEFNADAFSLDSNAVAEDLLHRLPGITIWGDNEITFNGKKVSSVLVNGKPFFSSDARVATQNIPKEIIDKIQVYNKDKNKDGEEEKEMNIVLKEGRERGVFGKLSAGIGTQNRDDSEGLVNVFNKRNQLSAGAAYSNVNKTLSRIDDLQLNATYGGMQVQTDFYPDFRKYGQNRDFASGIGYQYDFNKTNNSQRKNILKTNIFYRDGSSKLSDVSEMNLVNDKAQTNQSNAEQLSTNHTQNVQATLSYQLSKGFFNGLFIDASVDNKHNNSHYSNSTNNNVNDILSSEHSSGDTKGTTSNYKVAVKYRKENKAKSTKVYRLFALQMLDYDFEGGNSNTIRQEQKIVGFVNTTDSIDFDRAYDTRKQQQSHVLQWQIENLGRNILGRNTTIDMVQYVRFLGNEIDQYVSDKDVANAALTYKESFRQFNYKPSLTIDRKVYFARRVNLFDKYINFAVTATADILTEDNQSTIHSRDLRRSLRQFSPSARVGFLRNEYNKSITSLNLNWNRKETLPSINELSPVYDDFNWFFRNLGNDRLRNYTTNSIGLHFERNEFTRSASIIKASISAAFVENGIVDSTVFTDKGYRESYLMNDRQMQRNVRAVFSYRNAVRINQSSNFTLEMDIDGGKGVSTRFINQYLKTDNHSLSIRPAVYYVLTSRLKAGVRYNYYFNESKNDIQTFWSKSHDLNFSVTVSPVKGILFNSNVSLVGYNNSIGDNNIFLWNMWLSQRFFKKKNVELKVSALDLLKQNTAFYTSNQSGYLVFGRRNIIQQYFMLSIAFFPRYF